MNRASRRAASAMLRQILSTHKAVMKQGHGPLKDCRNFFTTAVPSAPQSAGKVQPSNSSSSVIGFGSLRQLPYNGRGVQQTSMSSFVLSSLGRRTFSANAISRAARPNWYQGRTVETIRSSPLTKAQAWIDRKVPRKWLFYGIIATNLAVFAAWAYAEDVARRFRDFGPLQFMYKNFASSWSNILRPWTLLTSCFSHRDLSHIFVNLFSFYFMAPAIFSILTASQCATLYLLAGLAGSTMQLASDLFLRSTPSFSLGASGAISGVLTSFAMAFPRNTLLLFAIIPVPAWAAVSGLVAYDMYLALKQPNGTVGAAAHLGGAAAGALYYLRLSRLGRLRRW